MQLTTAGLALDQKIWPLVVAREDYVLGALDARLRAALPFVFFKHEARASKHSASKIVF
ncbi:hypothetical protein V1286_001297 [Bradyrhizobium algeriense]|uniref:LysR family transcriptional regulator n=1 Tax=Bradyrhizobium algeriense TaxID=634784 RepID=A0ABU8B5E8_9BRAD